MEIFIVTLLAFFGEILGTITGLGNATFFVPSLSLFRALSDVLGIVAFIHVFSNITRLGLFWKNTDWKVFFKFGITNVIFVGLGALLTRFIDAKIIEITLGFALFVFAFYEVLFKQIKLPTSLAFESVSGAITGFFGGLVGTSGPFRSFVLINIGLSKDTYIATSVAVDFIGDILRLFVYISNGFVKVELIKFLPFVFVASFVGALFGQKLLKLIPQKLFVKITLITLILLGFSLIAKNLK
jgi:uncharacterized protein